MRTRTITATVIAALVVASPAAAKQAAYKGRTAEGQRISFKVGKRILWKVHTRLRVVCRASNQGVVTDPTFTAFRPDEWGFPLGHLAVAKDKYGYPVNTYSVRSKKRGRKIKGTVALRYSEMKNSPVDGSIRSQTCTGKAKFTAKRKG
jgi:hypothetical protein